MSVRRSSLRKQLLFWLLVPILTLWIVGSFMIYFIALDFATDAADSSLRDTIRYLKNRLHYSQDSVTLQLSKDTQALIEEDGKDHIYYQVIDPTGKVVAGYSQFPRPPIIRPGGTQFRSSKYKGAGVRVGCLKIPFIPNGNPMVIPLGQTLRPVAQSSTEPSGNRYVYIQVAETLLGREKLANAILINVVFPQFLLILLAAAAVWYGITRGLQPLETVRLAVMKRTPRDMNLLSGSHAPVEVEPLVDAINGLILRLSEDLERQRRFIADAAHQLRTPLAGLKVQVELAMRLTKPAEIHSVLAQTLIGVNRASHLIQQLLTLARSEPGAIDPTTLKQLDLRDLIRETTRELVPLALQRGIDLGFEGADEPAPVNGDPIRLRELANNLIENAILYTQSGGQVTTRVWMEECVYFTVEDNGPGIPLEERQLVFDRFHRVLGTQADGCGLGLSIVREIAQAHQAKVIINDGHGGVGTVVQVVFCAASLAVNPAVATARKLKG